MTPETDLANTDTDSHAAGAAIPIPTLAAALRQARLAAGWSQRELARRAGVHQPQVARAERGEDLQLSLLQRLVAPLGLVPALVPSVVAAIGGVAPSAGPPRALHDIADEHLQSWRAAWPAVNPEVFAVQARLLHAGRHVEAALEEVAAKYGLISGDVMVLGALRRSGAPFERTPTELKRMLWITLPGLKKRLDRLEALALITRSGNPSDRRGRVVRLTPAGVAMVEDMVAHSPAVLWNTLRAMPAPELVQLSASLRGLLVRLEAGEAPPQVNPD